MTMSLGVYVLGAADTRERQQLEAHLPGCQACLAELRRLAPLPGLLAGIPEAVRDTAGTQGRPVRPTARALTRGGTRTRWVAGAAACLTAAAVTGGLWLWSGNGGQQANVLTLTGADPATHVSATATLTAMSWGTSIQLQIRGLPQNVDCRLVVHSRAGRTEVSGVWDSWQDGPVSIPASASWLPSDIASLQVATPTENLLTISASDPTAQAGREVMP